MALLSQRAYAKHRGVTLRAVQKAIEGGRIKTTLDEKGRPKIDPVESDKRWEMLTDPSKQREPMPGGPTRKSGSKAPRGPPVTEPEDLEEADEQSGIFDADDDKIGAEDFFEAKARKEVYHARLAKLKFRQLDGQLVESSQVQEEWLKIVSAVKTRMLGIPSKVRARVPHLTLDDIATIEDEVRTALEEMAGMAGESGS